MKVIQRPGRILLTLGTRLEDVFLLGWAVRGVCEGAGFRDDDLRSLELALVEAVTNVIRHAFRGEEGYAVTIEIVISPESVVFRIVDRGAAMADRAFVRCDFDPADVASLPEGGMGKSIIAAVMDDIAYECEGGTNTLILTKKLPSRAEETP
ncbi:MAG TPA: ATP-binding protein [Syntrophales bacterium]|nr:ATP-binding protein [Syntrophales bacterium]HOM06375.1 ATP-binding protein [Syntrophales bacterium]HON99174.1 ATP-binding protein [Syntrophales bacterium]HPC00282.1 ATP-binding protein [Syntrophales bacterium]HPQ05945.1 ATP-binding protein [Syntrophales bacterium]